MLGPDEVCSCHRNHGQKSVTVIQLEHACLAMLKISFVFFTFNTLCYITSALVMNMLLLCIRITAGTGDCDLDLAGYSLLLT